MNTRQKGFDKNRPIMSTSDSQALMEVIKNMQDRMVMQDKLLSDQQDQISKLTTNNVNEMNFDENSDSLCDVEIMEELPVTTVPDLVKDLKSYSGDPIKLTQWIADVDFIIEIYGRHKNSYNYKVILRYIRRKIEGDADDYLTNNKILLSWRSMRTALLDHFSDQRDLITLNHQISNLRRNNDSIESFYQKINEMRSSILNVITVDPEVKLKIKRVFAIGAYATSYKSIVGKILHPSSSGDKRRLGHNNTESGV